MDIVRPQPPPFNFTEGLEIYDNYFEIVNHLFILSVVSITLFSLLCFAAFAILIIKVTKL